MPRAYLIAVSADYALDQRTNNFSLFHLIEQIEVRQVPLDLPLDVHLHYEFTETERGRPFQIRIVLIDQTGAVITTSKPTDVTSPSPRQRIVLTGLRVPAPGHFLVYSEIRAADGVADGWERSAFGWPVDVRQGDV